MTTNVLIVALIAALIIAVICDAVRMYQYFDAKYRYAKQTERRLKARNVLLKEELFLVIKKYMKDCAYDGSDEGIRTFIEDYFKEYKQ